MINEELIFFVCGEVVRMEGVGGVRGYCWVCYGEVVRYCIYIFVCYLCLFDYVKYLNVVVVLVLILFELY